MVKDIMPIGKITSSLGGMDSVNKDLLTIEDVCQELGIGKNTAYGLIKGKQIKSAKVGKRHLIHRAELQKYIASTMLCSDK